MARGYVGLYPPNRQPRKQTAHSSKIGFLFVTIWNFFAAIIYQFKNFIALLIFIALITALSFMVPNIRERYQMCKDMVCMKHRLEQLSRDASTTNLGYKTIECEVCKLHREAMKLKEAKRAASVTSVVPFTDTTLDRDT